ncbi:MAG: hypothetical protein GY940_36430 [bacterium]|nr:hypothetical protein [bacterium]
MKKQLLFLLIFFIVIGACKKSSDVSPGPGVEPPPPPGPTEQLIGKMFYHDTGPRSQYDIFTAELYIVPKATSAARAVPVGHPITLPPDRGPLLTEGIHKYRNLEINGKVLDRVVVNTPNAVDISEYDFEVRDVVNLTDSTSDDFAVNANGNNQITFVTAPNGLVGNANETQIVYMDIDDLVRHQLTPVNGNYSGSNFDPDWKTDEIIVWSHSGQIVEVNINDLQVSGSLIPEVGSAIFDPKYSPDGTKLLFNTRQNRKKNSWMKNLVDNQITHLLPDNYFNAYEDDNPTWVFSSSLITGHIFISGGGRIYTLDIGSQDFLIITDGARDFRYVTPIMLDSDVYLIFSDWTDNANITLWISNQNGTVLRELDQTGDEAIFQALGLSVPESEEEMREIARQYAEMFQF